MYHKLGTKLLYIYSKVNNAKVDAKNLCGNHTDVNLRIQTKANALPKPIRDLPNAAIKRILEKLNR